MSEFIAKNWTGYWNVCPRRRLGSSVRLTGCGEGISTDLAVKAWTAGGAPKLAERVYGKQPFEISELCAEHVKLHFAEEESLQSTVRAVKQPVTSPRTGHEYN